MARTLRLVTLLVVLLVTGCTIVDVALHPTPERADPDMPAGDVPVADSDMLVADMTDSPDLGPCAECTGSANVCTRDVCALTCAGRGDSGSCGGEDSCFPRIESPDLFACAPRALIDAESCDDAPATTTDRMGQVVDGPERYCRNLLLGQPGVYSCTAPQGSSSFACTTRCFDVCETDEPCLPADIANAELATFTCRPPTMNDILRDWADPLSWCAAQRAQPTKPWEVSWRLAERTRDDACAPGDPLDLADSVVVLTDRTMSCDADQLPGTDLVGAALYTQDEPPKVFPARIITAVRGRDQGIAQSYAHLDGRPYDAMNRSAPITDLQDPKAGCPKVDDQRRILRDRIFSMGCGGFALAHFVDPETDMPVSIGLGDTIRIFTFEDMCRQGKDPSTEDAPDPADQFDVALCDTQALVDSLGSVDPSTASLANVCTTKLARANDAGDVGPFSGTVVELVR
ncbi:MAG: hypothetical protein AAGI01_07130 [Myxococcota bacterium]